MVVGAIVLFVAGVAVGRVSTTGSSTPAPAPTAASCADVTKSFSDFLNSATTAPKSSDEGRRNARMAMQVIVQNPTCFSTAERAAAQELLDTR